MKAIALFAACLAAASSFADDLNKPSHYLSIFAGDSARILGSDDIRDGLGISYGFGRPEPRFDFAGFRAQLVYEGYADFTHSLDCRGRSPDSAAAGALAFGRWFNRLPGTKSSVYLDIGWGLQYASTPTFDLPSEINSTPFADLGVAFPGSKYDTLVGLRFLHISNAGFVQRNRGQDEFFLTVGVRY